MPNSEAGAGVLDAGVRQRALSSRSSFIVQAPAGSGKTELLIQRYLTLLAGASRPEAVVALTFTRKAAAEMRERVIEALVGAEGPEPTQSYLRDRHRLACAVLERSASEGWNILDSPHRLEINTIDSLCAKLTRSLPLLSSFGGSPTATDDSQPLYQEAVRRTLDSAPRDPQLAADLAALLSRREMRIGQIEQQLIAMLGKRDQWAHAAVAARSTDGADALLARIESGIAKAMNESVAAVSRHFGDTQRRLLHEIAVATRADIEGKGKSCDWPTLGGPDLLGDDIEAIDAWKQARKLLLTQAGGLRAERLTGANTGTPQRELWLELREWFVGRDETTRNRVIDALRALDKVPADPTFATETREAMRAMFHLLFRAHAQLWALFLESGSTDFVEISSRAVSALGYADAPSDLLELLDRRVEHLLVDEFQDTSVGQCELVRRLTAGWLRGDGRTLFLVGDPMQSIYRFRKAEVGLFLQARSDAGLFDNIDLEFLQLSVNFRSQPRVIEWVNDHFSVLMGDADDMAGGTVGYAPSSARPGAVEGALPEVHFWRDAEAEDEAGTHEAEAEGLAVMIGDELLPAACERGGRMAVLVRARSHAAPLLRALRARSIAYVPEGLDRLSDRPAVQDLRSLTRFILHRGDRLCGLALLRGPLGGLSLAELAALVEPDVARVVDARDRSAESDRARTGVSLRSVTDLLRDGSAAVSADTRLRLDRIAGILAGVRAELGRRRLCDLVEGAWLALGGPAVVGAGGAGDAQAYFTLLSAIEKAGAVDPAQLDRHLEKAEAPSGGAAEADLSIMTMHAAKGLEFDTVVLLGLGRRPGGGDPEPLVFETEPRTGEMNALALQGARGASHDDDVKYDFIRHRENGRDRGESLRLLYVGATRARERLLLSAAEPSVDKNGEYKAARGTLLASIASAGGFEAALVHDVQVSGTAAAAAMARLRADCMPAPPPATAPVRLRFESWPSDVETDIRPEAFDVVNLRRNAGTTAHHFLERIALDGIDSWDADRLHRAVPRIRRRLMRMGTPEQQLDEGQEIVLRALRSSLEDETGVWLLGPRDEGRCEWKLSRFDTGDGSVAAGLDQTDASLDRSFLDDGVRWIVDYKIIEPPAGHDVDAFVADRTTHYRAQLESYAALVGALQPDVPICLGLYFPLLPRFACWRPGRVEVASSPQLLRSV